ncbi:hypothetical protein LOAG_02738 [Loa loa]|uniref:SAM domain-containing protein n=1 Tax=Loa loa TaxID=7209 RepID=A0A1S0U6H4_LOALO|nr:hypothetical protein LOAG_02738 [Loa loa]EFO25743.2 hypothetical protein LOAG_02738 [Loa loa]
MSDNDPPPVLTKQATCSTTATADSSVSIVTTCIGNITLASNSNDSFTKTTTIVTPSSSSSSVSDSTQTTSGRASSNPSAPSSNKSITSDTKNATNVIAGSSGTAVTTTTTTTSASSSNAETASSTSSTPQPAPKSRRKPTSRTKKDAVDKTKTSTAVVSSSSATQMVPQTPLMLTSASPGQFMLVHHNGQCYMMSATQYFNTNQQIAAVRPQQQQQQQLSTPSTSCTTTITTSTQDFFKVIQQQQAQSVQNSTNAVAAAQQFYSQQQFRHTHPLPSQQQYVQPGFVASSATLGQLARSLAPKPALPGPGSVAVVATSTQMSSTTVTTTVTTTTSSSTAGQGSDASLGRSAQQQSPQQLGTASVQQMQPSMFPQGIQLRTPPGSSGIVFQMPSGAYTYVHQLVTPQQRTSIAIPQQQQIPACIGQAVAASQPQNQQQHQPSPASSPTQKVVPSATAESKNKQTSSNVSKESTTIERKGSNASPTVDKESQPLAQMVSIPNKPPAASVKSSEALSKNVRGGGKHSGSGRKTGTVKIATPQPIAPTNLVPVGAPVPMMVMSAPMPQLSSFGGHAAVPFMGPNGQIIHQQLISNPPVPTHQMIPVFQQQQQTTAHFPISQSAPTQVQDAASHDSQKTVTDDDNGYADSGIENEPPPLLVQGESKDALDIHMMFTKEAERYYQKTGRKGKIIHLIEGFEIEESDEPFPCDPPCRLSDWLLSEMEDKNGRKICKERRWSSSPKKLIDEKGTEPILDITTEKMETKKGRAKASPTKSEASSEKAEKKTRKRKTNELDRLLQMDFGPSHGRLSDIMQKSVYKPTKESKEALPPPPLPPPTKTCLTKPKGRPPSSSVDKQKLEKVEVSEPVMERFIIEDAADISPKAVTKKLEESPATADQSLNSSSKSSADTGTGSLLVSFSDEELDTERCNYCNGLLRLKRLENHPQYCSKKCRKLWKKNPTISEEQVGRSFNASPRLPVIRSTDTSPINKDINPTVQNLSIISEPSSTGSTIDLQQRTPPTLTLKMVSPQQAEIVKSPRGLSSSYSLGECSKAPSTSVSPAMAVTPAVEHATMDFLSRPTKTWTCDEVARWVSSVTGNEDCANTFRNQDIDGQSLLLLPDNAHNNLVTLLGLKLGPVVKILNALKELSSKSINAT